MKLKQILAFLTAMTLLLSVAALPAAAETETGTLHPCRFILPGNAPPDLDTGVAAVNEQLHQDGVDIQLELIYIPMDVYEQKLNLMLATGEPFELIHVMNDIKSMSTLAGMDAIQSIEQLLPKYPELVSKFTENQWHGTVFGGEQYGVPVYWKSLIPSFRAVHYRTDVAKAVGYDAFPDTPDAAMDLMKKSQEYILGESGLKAYHWLHQTKLPAYWLHRSYDTYPFYVDKSLSLVLCRQDGTIDSYFESDEFKKDADYYYQLYHAGLIDPDILSRDSQKKYDDANYGAFLPSPTFDAGVETKILENIKVDSDIRFVFAFGADKPDIVTSIVGNCISVSSTAEDPESGLKFLNWLYSKEENHDLFIYGIEGVHYEKAGDQRITKFKDDAGKFLYYVET